MSLKVNCVGSGSLPFRRAVCCWVSVVIVLVCFVNLGGPTIFVALSMGPTAGAPFVAVVIIVLNLHAATLIFLNAIWRYTSTVNKNSKFEDVYNSLYYNITRNYIVALIGIVVIFLNFRLRKSTSGNLEIFTAVFGLLGVAALAEMLGEGRRGLVFFRSEWGEAKINTSIIGQRSFGFV